MEIEPLKYRRMLGVKVTANWHDLPAASAPPQGVLPVPATDQSVLAVNERVSEAALVLVAVTGLGKLENPSAGLSNNKLAGVNGHGRGRAAGPGPRRLGC